MTFLLTDVEGSTRAWEAHGAAMAAAVGRHYEILDDAVRSNRGVRPIEQGEGDSLVAAFERPTDAVAAALAAQRGLAAESWPGGIPLTVRMAVHTGEAQIRDELYYAGPSIIRCARLRALGHGAQVLISGTTADLLADGLPGEASLLPLGVHRLKDLRRPLRVFQLAHPGIRGEFPPLKSLDALPNNLPVQLTSFVGRRAEVAELAGLVGEHRLVSIVGTGGAGKTRLAAQVAAEVVEGFPDGVWWVDLSSVTDPAGVPHAVMTALGIGDDRGLDPLDRVAGYLGSGRVLVLVDNCEHLLGAAASAVERLLRLCSGVAAVATSREPLGVAGEVAWRVAPMSLPAEGEPASVEAALASEGVQLFAERVFEARPTFKLEESNAATVAEICARLDGLPLAIELAAARARNLSPERILAGLTDRFRLLTGGARTALARQQTLQASVEWSHDLLSTKEQVLFRRLAAFSGGFALEAAEAIAAGPGPDGASPSLRVGGHDAASGGGIEIDEFEVLDLLGDLVDKSLVTFDGERYGMPATLREFAGAQLLASGEATAVRDRHLAHFLERAEAADDLNRREVNPALMHELRPDHDNLRAALEWTAESENDELAQRLVIALMLFWVNKGYFTEGLAWHRRVLARMPAGADPVRCKVVWSLGNMSLQCVELSNGLGVSDLTEAFTMAQELNDPALLARPFTAMGAIQVLATPTDVIPLLEQATAVARACGDEWAISYARWWEAATWIWARNRPESAEPALAELEEIGRRGQSVSCLGWNNGLRGMAFHQQGRLAEARAEHELALARSYECDEALLGVGSMLWGGALLDLGDYEACERMLTASLARCRRHMDACRESMVEIHAARLPLALGDHAAAAERAAGMEAKARAGGIPVVIQWVMLVRGRAALEAGDLKAARTAFDEAVTIADHMGWPYDRAYSHYHLALLARAEGDPGVAEDRLHQVLAQEVEFGFRARATDTLEVLASLAAAGQSSAEATRLFAAAHALREATGQARWPLDQPRYDADLLALRSTLGDKAYERIWAEGLGLSFADAAAYASRARGERKRPTSGWDSLTPMELQVAALAATGATNNEIGARLFIAPTTAKTHLGRIYAKLDVANRAALAAQATARGLGVPQRH